MLERVSILRDLLNGHATDVWMFGEKYTGFLFSNTLIWPLFLAAIAFSLFLGITRKDQRCRSFPLLSALAISCILIIIAPLQIGPHHWIMLYPIPQIAIAWVFVEFWRLIRTGIVHSRFQVCASALILCLGFSIVALNVSTTAQYFSHLQANRGAQGWSDGIYKVIDALKGEYSHRPIYFMDWGFFTQACLLSHGSLHVHEYFWSHLSDSKPWSELMQAVSDPSNVFVVHAPGSTKYISVRAAFENAVVQTGLRVKKEQTFYDGRGRPWGQLIELTPSRVQQSSATE